VSWQYDALNRITGIVEGTNTTAYRYDLSGKPVYREYPSHVKENRAYDPMGRLLTMTTSNLVSDAWFQMQYQYDAVGSAREMNQTSSGLSGQATDATTYWQYDARYRLLNETQVMDVLSGPVTNIYVYGWDAADNRTNKLTYIDGALTENITYTNNALNQMEGWHDSVAGKTVAYGYDANGSRTNKTVTGSSASVTSYVYDEDNRLLEASVGVVVNTFA
jgi:YD repeat-containing protein